MSLCHWQVARRASATQMMSSTLASPRQPAVVMPKCVSVTVTQHRRVVYRWKGLVADKTMVPMAGRSEPLTSDVELRETNRLGQRLRIRAGSV